jgi:hypothetical protein
VRERRPEPGADMIPAPAEEQEPSALFRYSRGDR